MSALDLAVNICNSPKRARRATDYFIGALKKVTCYGALLGITLSFPLAGHAQSYTKTQTIEYHDDFSTWVLGQVSRTTLNGIETSRADYGWMAMPWKTYSFGKLTQTLIYDSTSLASSGQLGTIKTLSDGNNNIIALGAWKRGIPQTITFPATPDSSSGAIQSAVVNDFGWITSVTGETGSKSCYSHDAMGRLTEIVYPSEAAVATCDEAQTYWKKTSLTFQPIAAAEYGVPAGHWRQTVTTGNAKKISYFDAMWRPLVTKELDDTNGTTETLTKRFQRFSYDENGRMKFASYSGETDALSAGTWTEYDALGRVTSVSQNSELTSAGNPGGLLTTLTEYLPGFKVRVTNPRQMQTTTSYMVFDTPSYEFPVAISEPEGRDTSIGRDIFGKPTVINRGGNGIVETRRYVYDINQQLCKMIEPESGATIMDYDAAGNLQWVSTGLTTLTSPLSCDTIAGRDSGRKVTRYYDARNRLSQLIFPDGRGNQLWSYAPDGLPAEITTLNFPNSGGPVVNTYNYNNRRLPTGEGVAQPGWYAWNFGYAYDPNGNLASQSYPSGMVVSYLPNALGQATQAGPYATGVSYFPNGAIKQFTYGNGIAHQMAQNARQLPGTSTDSGAIALEYVYDANANVQYIYDWINPASHRYMYYDGLDRLTSAGSQIFGGDHWHRFTYDTLDNLKSWKLTGIKDYAEYVYTGNQLTNIKNSSGATVVGIDYDPQGNVTNKNGLIFQFDFGNRLRSNPEEQGFTYDAYGRRVSVTRGFMNPRYRKFGYSQTGQLLREENTNGNSTTEHVYLGGSLVATKSSAFGQPSAITYVHTDALGSPVAKSTSAGILYARTNYEPFGAVIDQPTYEGVGFTGHVHDSASGLIYMQQRYYDPDNGRFLSVDPVTAHSNPVGAFNRYWYANNNPYRFTDPDGRQSFGHEADVPWWNVPMQIGNWFNETRDLSVQYAFTQSPESQAALLTQYENAGNAIIAVQTLAMPEMGVAAKAEAGAARFFAASGDKLAARFFDGAKYSERIFAQKDKFHAFPAAADGFAARFGEVKRVTDSRGASVEMMTMRGEMQGSKGWVQGTFEYIKNRNNEIYHRLFKPDN